MPQVHQATPLSIPDSDALRYLPEGPVALNQHGLLSWVAIAHGPDVSKGSINVLDLSTMSNTTYDLPGRPGFAFPCSDGRRFVAGVERSLGIFDPDDGSWSVLEGEIDADVTNTIINDGLVHEDNLIFGTKDLAFAEKKAGLYLYRGRDRKLIRLRDDQVCSNGKAIRHRADGSLSLIDIDSPTRLVVEYPLDLDAGTLGQPNVRLDLTSDPGVPDGAVLTPDGNDLIVAIFLPGAAGVGQTRRYDLETGDLKEVWETDGSPQNTCPALIPHDGEVKLLITTAVENMTADVQSQCPNAGQLFVAETSWRGELPVTQFPI
ncbi:MAG: SMP-30/gluconolactonase/LRE family protein [Planctomycetota bacterium]